MTANRYHRLPGGLRGFVRRNSAWQGEDHLLMVSGTRYHERYQRVYYRDVLAITVQRTRRMTASWLWFVLVFYGFVFGITLRSVPLWGALLLAASAMAVVMQIVFAFAFGCRLLVATAVGNVEVPGVMRTWDASRFLKNLAPLIADAQRWSVLPPVEESQP